jgi:hypothetical protein
MDARSESSRHNRQARADFKQIARHETTVLVEIDSFGELMPPHQDALLLDVTQADQTSTGASSYILDGTAEFGPSNLLFRLRRAEGPEYDDHCPRRPRRQAPLHLN